MFFITKIFLILITFSVNMCKSHQPSYQVALFVQLHPPARPIHFCNGIIVQSRLILTTASCVYYNSPAISITPSMITVVSGTSTAFNDELTLQVADIFIANNFNYTTGKNDLAILRLNGMLPLDSRNDINWITLDDDENYDDSPCLANFYTRHFSNGLSNYIQSEQLPILDAEACRSVTDYFSERDKDICSFYYLPAGFNCSALAYLQNFNNDRGTGLVCGYKLIGLLSTTRILTVENITNCLANPIKAYYTAIAPHIVWIFNFIIEEDLKMLNENEYISSMPYAGATNAFVEPNSITESVSEITKGYTTEAYTTSVKLQATETVAYYNAAAIDSINIKLIACIVIGVILIVVNQK